MLIYIVLKRDKILIIISHCRIIIRGDTQEITIIRVYYSRWVEKKKRAQEKIYILVLVQRSTKWKNSKTNLDIHSVQSVLKYQGT